MIGFLGSIGELSLTRTRYGEMWYFARDEVIGRSLEQYGEWAEHEISLLSGYIVPETLVIDIGANIGTHTLAFARRHPSAAVIGFEAQPVMAHT